MLFRSEDARIIGSRLGVKTVLEGSVRRAGETIRISAQLIDAANGYRLWSDRYDRTHGDVFAIQDDISSTIAEVLRGKLVAATEPAAPATRDPDAYELFLKGRYEWNRRTETAVRSAVRSLDQAIARDPLFARAYAARADCYVVLGAYGLAQPEAVMMQAKADALAALEPAGLALVQLVTPATPPDRLTLICKQSQGFVYAVTRTGITGGQTQLPPQLTDYLASVKKAASVPVCAGFGVRERRQVELIARHADGVIVGSALVEALERGENPATFLRGLRP